MFYYVNSMLVSFLKSMYSSTSLPLHFHLHHPPRGGRRVSGVLLPLSNGVGPPFVTYRCCAGYSYTATVYDCDWGKVGSALLL